MTITEMVKAINENDNYEYLAIRSCDQEYKAGEIAEDSYAWDYELDESTYYTTGETLDGACGSILRTSAWDSDEEIEAELKKALSRNGEYNFDHQYIIAGNSMVYGNDPDEIIIRDAVVIGVIR